VSVVATDNKVPTPRNRWRSALSDFPLLPKGHKKRTPITQEEFNQIIANTPEGQPIVQRRSGTALTIGSPFAPPPHPELMTIKFVDCRFENGVFVVNTFQAVMTFEKCIMRMVSLETGGVVQVMEIKQSKIQELRTLDGGRYNGLTLIGSKISQILAYDGGDTPCFQAIGFQ
jgi:hypothetical protein